MSIADELRQAITDHRQETGDYPDYLSLNNEKHVELKKWAHLNAGLDEPDSTQFMGVEVRIDHNQTDGVLACDQ